jgi:hypothetical protein
MGSSIMLHTKNDKLFVTGEGNQFSKDETPYPTLKITSQGTEFYLFPSIEQLKEIKLAIDTAILKTELMEDEMNIQIGAASVIPAPPSNEDDYPF